MKILIIVESPAKAQTIQKILGNDDDFREISGSEWGKVF